MREILFKAKRIDDGKWVEGYYQKRYDLLGNEEHLIFHADSYKVWEYAEVDPETICQYTGLCDKNGKKIWEGDIISYQRDNDDCPFPNKDTKKRFGKVFYQGFRSTFAIGMGRNGSRSIMMICGNTFRMEIELRLSETGLTTRNYYRRNHE